jgi:GYF domain 2
MDKLQKAQDLWYYTEGAERMGPVSFNHLQARALDGNLNPRFVMVWTEGMEHWKLAGDVPQLFERHDDNGDEADAEEVVSENLAKSSGPVAPYLSPSGELSSDWMLASGAWAGATRRSYILATLIFPGLWERVTTSFSPLLESMLGFQIMSILGIALSIVPLVMIVWFGLQRLVNLGMSRWWFLGFVVPALNFWVAYRCFACPAGYAFHKKMDGRGIFLAILYWIFMLLLIGMIAFVVVCFMGVLVSPELGKQIQELLKTTWETR